MHLQEYLSHIKKVQYKPTLKLKHQTKEYHNSLNSFLRDAVTL